MLARSRVSTGQEGSTRRICNARAWPPRASARGQPSRKSGGDVRVAARLVGLPPARPPHLYQTLLQRPLLLQTATPVLQPPGQDGVAARPVTPAVGRKRPLPSRCTPPTTHRTRHTNSAWPASYTATTAGPDGTGEETRRDAPQPRVRRAAVAVLPCPRVALMPPCPPPRATHAPPAPSIPMGAARPHEALSLP
jgi:hypothetical protein